MSIVHISGYDVEQVPIELIEPGNTVLTHLPDGSPYTFVVELKRFDIDKVAGTSKIGLQAARNRHPWRRPGRDHRSSGWHLDPPRHQSGLNTDQRAHRATNTLTPSTRSTT